MPKNQTNEKPKREKSEKIVNLFELRKRLGNGKRALSIDKFVDNLQYYVSKSSISDYENGKTSPNADVLIDISESYDVSIDWLVGLSGTSSTDSDAVVTHKYTGLSERAVDMLHFYLENDPSKIQLLNLILEQDSEEYRSRIIGVNKKKRKNYIVKHDKDKHPDILDDIQSMLLAYRQDDLESLTDVIERADFYFEGVDEPLPLKSLEKVDFKRTMLHGNKLANLVEQMYANRVTSKLKSLGKQYFEMISEPPKEF